MRVIKIHQLILLEPDRLTAPVFSQERGSPADLRVGMHILLCGNYFPQVRHLHLQNKINEIIQ